MDKSKFTERPGDSEGFVEDLLARDMARDVQSYPYRNEAGETVWSQLDQRDLDRVYAIWASQGNKGAR
jgi:hypothetical protein